MTRLIVNGSPTVPVTGERWGWSTRWTRVSAMIWPAAARVACRPEAVGLAEEGGVDADAVLDREQGGEEGHGVGAGRNVVQRSASARRRRSATEAGSSRQARC